MEVPGIGFLPINAFVLHAQEPVVVDTGLSLDDRDFMAALRHRHRPRRGALDLVDPPRPRPHGRAVQAARGGAAGAAGDHLRRRRASCRRSEPLPLDRLYLLNPGQSLDVGDRTLHAFRPPLFDSPATVGFYDDRSRTCFSSDCYGAPLPTAELAGGPDVRDVPADQLRAAQLLWAAVDSPWVHTVDQAAYMKTVRTISDIDCATVLSTHLPPAIDLGTQLEAMLAAAPRPTPSSDRTRLRSRRCWPASSRWQRRPERAALTPRAPARPRRAAARSSAPTARSRASSPARSPRAPRLP